MAISSLATVIRVSPRRPGEGEAASARSPRLWGQADEKRSVITSQPHDTSGELDALEALANHAYEQDAVTEVIRPSAVLPELAARAVLGALVLDDARRDGLWVAEPACWRRYDRPWDGEAGTPGRSALVGTIQVAYGTPRRCEITVFRVTITLPGSAAGWTVASLCDEAFGHGGLTLASCPRVGLAPPPRPFRMR